VLSNPLSCCNQVEMSIETIKVTRFGGKSSLSAFKYKVLAYLQTIGLKDIAVSGTETRGASSGSSGSSGKRSGEEYEEDEPPRVSSKSSGISTSGSSKDTVVNGISRKQKSEKAYAILLNLLDDEVIDLVAHVEAGDAHGVWTVLLETYETKSTASLCYTLDQFMNIKFDDRRESFDVYKARFMNLLVALKEMDEVLSLAIQRYVILRDCLILMKH
jgi:gag-polypeptide of LTR copia-type